MRSGDSIHYPPWNRFAYSWKLRAYLINLSLDVSPVKWSYCQRDELNTWKVNLAKAEYLFITKDDWSLQTFWVHQYILCHCRNYFSIRVIPFLDVSHLQFVINRSNWVNLFLEFWILIHNPVYSIIKEYHLPGITWIYYLYTCNRSNSLILPILIVALCFWSATRRSRCPFVSE